MSLRSTTKSQANLRRTQRKLEQERSEREAERVAARCAIEELRDEVICTRTLNNTLEGRLEVVRQQRDEARRRVAKLEALLHELPDVMPVTSHLPMARIKGDYMERVDAALGGTLRE